MLSFPLRLYRHADRHRPGCAHAFYGLLDGGGGSGGAGVLPLDSAVARRRLLGGRRGPQAARPGQPAGLATSCWRTR
ncbi:hypothetical protein ACPA9J_19085 [Pseudomonas aeruginosa]